MSQATRRPRVPGSIPAGLPASIADRALASGTSHDVRHGDGPSDAQASAPQHPVVVRRLPYPYRAMLAICSDLDETPDGEVYRECMRFLNTTRVTSMGPGVGLEVGNSIYFDMPRDQFAYWTTTDAGRAMVQTLIRSGHIDCLHSFGDLATTRAQAARALDELARHDCRLEVWIDHAVAPSNFGADIMRGTGDVPGAEAYHADLTCQFGVQYVWRGRVTSVTGQDVPRRLGGIYQWRHPLASAPTFAREFAKGLLARRGRGKYAMHAPNQVLRAARLRDGQPVWEFIRSNPYWGGVDRGETAAGLADVIVEPLLERLIEREGVSVLYTHLGKIRRRLEPFGPRTQRAFRLLARAKRAGLVLVTTTRRLLGYCRAVRAVSLSTAVDGGGLRIDVLTADLEKPGSLVPADLDGLTLYVEDPSRTRLTLNGREVSDVRRNGPDHTGRLSVSIPWKALEFPEPCP
jgi:hypothetical protein